MPSVKNLIRLFLRIRFLKMCAIPFMGFGRKIHIKREAVTVSLFVLYISSRDGFPFLKKITAVRTAGRLKALFKKLRP